MAVTIRIDLSAVQELLDRLAEFRSVFIAWVQVGCERMILPKLKAEIPVRTGHLRAARQFYRHGGGGYFGWDASGFYWRFQEGLSERQRAIVRSALPAVIDWATGRARAQLRI